MIKLVFGHKNPDTDTICSALAYAAIAKELNEEVKAVRLGNVNKETQYVLDYLQIKAPELMETLEDKSEVVLVDHNEIGQSINNIENGKITAVIDHHRVANFETTDPIYMNVQPVGCTATILLEMANQNNIELDKTTATLMLSAIISDSLLFKSPTCTEKDVKAAKELAKISEIDVDKYGMDMLKAGTDLSDNTALELIHIDSKEFETKNGLFEVAQVNTVDINEFLTENETELITAITETIKQKDLKLFVLLVTDIVNSNSQAIVLGDEIKTFEAGLNVNVVENKTMLKGVVSRKKQVVPFL